MILHRFLQRRLQTEQALVDRSRVLAIERDHLSTGLAAPDHFERPGFDASRDGVDNSGGWLQCREFRRSRDRTASATTSARRPLTATFAPFAKSTCARARPMPLDPHVLRTRLPALQIGRAACRARLCKYG